MNQRMLAALTMAVVGPAAGCVIETANRDHGSDDGAWLAATWALRNMSDGATTACPRGFDTVELVVQPVDDTGAPAGDPAVDLFDCDALAGTSTSLLADRYAVWIEVRSHDLATLYAQSLSQLVDLRRDGQNVAIDVLNDGGYFQLGWDLVGGTTNRPLDCTQVAGLDSLVAISTNVADARIVYDDPFRCEDHAAVTRGLLQGSYTISIDAVSAGTSIGGIASLTDQVIYRQNRVTDLGHLIIPIDGL
jgi:hypothetical protein